MAYMGWPLPLPIWSINYIHFKHNIFKNEQFLSSSFEMAHICILLVIKIVLKSTKIDYSKIQMCAISKLLDKNGSFLDILTLKCMRLIDQEYSGRGLPIWATPLPSKWVFYSVK